MSRTSRSEPGGWESTHHFHMWMDQQRALLKASDKFTQRDAEILAHSYVRQFPSRLHIILAELTMEKQDHERS